MKSNLTKHSLLKKLHSFLPFIIIALFFFVMHLTYTCHTDDLYNKNFHSSMTFWEEIKYLKTLYTSWSSRLLVNFCIHIMLHFSPVVWTIGNVIMLSLFSYCICSIFFQSKRTDNCYMFMALLFLYPFTYQTSAGWLVTTMTYIWPLAIGSFFFYRLSKRLQHTEPVHPFEFLLNIALLAYCTNQEQFNLFTLLLLTAILTLCIYKKTHYKSTFLYLLYSILSLVFHLTCPGNSARKYQETANWFADYEQLSLLSKIDLGLSSTLEEFYFKFNPLFLIFCILLCFIIYQKYTQTGIRMLALVPLLTALLFGPLKPLFLPSFSSLETITNSVTEYGIITNANCLNFRSYIPLFLILLISICIILCIYLVFENTFQTVLALTLLFAGMATRMAIAFSPTVWASSMRTYTILYFAIISIICMLIEKLQKEHSTFVLKLFLFLAMPLAVCTYIEFFYTISMAV